MNSKITIEEASGNADKVHGGKSAQDAACAEVQWGETRAKLLEVLRLSKLLVPGSHKYGLVASPQARLVVP